MRSENWLKYERERCGLAISTNIQQPSARFCFFTAGLLYFESNSYSFCDAYSHGHTGSRPKWAIGFLLASTSGRCLEQTRDSDPQLALIHLRHAKPSRSPILIAWKSVEEAPVFWLGLLSQLIMYVDHTSPNSHSSHTVVNVQVSCLSLWPLKLCNRCSCNPACVFLKRPPADFAIHYNTLLAAKEQLDATSYIPCILFLVHNWSIIGATLCLCRTLH